jgi:hypothetical protein
MTSTIAIQDIITLPVHEVRLHGQHVGVIGVYERMAIKGEALTDKGEQTAPVVFIFVGYVFVVRL